MFGYVTVDKSEMLVKDFEAYKAIYCSLCKQLGKEYTFLSRFILSYDCTFFALLALALQDECPGFSRGSCRFNPLKKCNYIKSHSEYLSMASALSIISVYYKLIDNISDGGFFEKLGCRFLMLFFHFWHKKASKKYPLIEDAVSRMSTSQFEVEQDKSCSVDKASEPTAIMLSEVMTQLVDKDDKDADEKTRIYQTFGYFLGKWIYLCDAANDYESDIKHGGFNPYVILYADKKQHRISDINESLNHCLSEAYLTLKLIQFKRFDRIIDNILVYGLPKKQKEILFKEKEN